ncbi:hypothetical protein [Methylobacterium nodulans]|uniref:Uncharacterized protein n=1 Tax=Methylobacterium nodulans (strain LMG 21967 / CNCM I-2342 / ORS 2060) TaxID=460265 RepID=B8IRJ0_METNO|nr:hypothetical protein [Methylobacterium nodulans]ACL58730.1 conserved hypothetical protein [Methylobacterium nodulans ORS 2060]
MTQITYYVVQQFKKDSNTGAVYPIETVEKSNKVSAELALRNLAEPVVGAIAFSRTGDPATGEWADAVVLATGGEMPPEFFEGRLPW